MSAAASFFLGHCLLRSGQQAQAIEYWLSIDEPTRRDVLVAYWHYAGRLEALKLYAAGRAAWPSRPQPRRVGIIVYENREPWATLPKTLERILDANALTAKQAEAAVILGDLVAREKQHDRAKAYYRRGLDYLKAFRPPSPHPDFDRERAEITEQLESRLAAYEAKARAVEAARAREEALAKAERSQSPAVRRANARFKDAQRLAMKEDFAGAAAAMREFVESAAASTHPRWNEGCYLLGRYLLDAGDREGSLAHWTRASGFDPESAYRARALLDTVDHELFVTFDVDAARQNIEALGRALRDIAAPAAGTPIQTPDVKRLNDLDAAGWQEVSLLLLQRQALLAWLEGDAAQAAALSERASKARLSLTAEAVAGVSYLEARQTKRAAEFLARSDVESGSVTAPAFNPKSRASVALRVGDFYFVAGDDGRARHVFNRVAEPDSALTPTPEEEVYALLRAGHCCHRQFKYGLARAYYDELLKRKGASETSGVAVAMLRRAVLEYSEAKRPDSALAMMREIYTRFPTTPQAQDAMFYTGVIYEWSHRKAQAVEAYRAALAAYPNHERLKIAVATRLKAMGVKPAESVPKRTS